MPIYEYQCAACHEVFEVFQKVSDPPPEAHSCGSKEVRRLISNTSFVLRGTGWYKTDYAEKPAAMGGKPKNDAESKGTGAVTEGSGTDANAKPGSDSAPAASSAADTKKSPGSSTGSNSPSKPAT